MEVIAALWEFVFRALVVNAFLVVLLRFSEGRPQVIIHNGLYIGM